MTDPVAIGLAGQTEQKEQTEFLERRLKGREQMWADWMWRQQWPTSNGNSFQAFPPLFVLQATIAGRGGHGTKLHVCYIPYRQMLSSNCSGKLLLCVTIVTNYDQNWRCRTPGNKASNSSIGWWYYSRANKQHHMLSQITMQWVRNISAAELQRWKNTAHTGGMSAGLMWTLPLSSRRSGKEEVHHWLISILYK